MVVLIRQKRHTLKGHPHFPEALYHPLTPKKSEVKALQAVTKNF